MGIIEQLVWNNYYTKVENYSFELCKSSDINLLRTFLRDYWRKDHPILVHEEFMDWQYYDSKKGVYNFILAKHKKSDEIHGIYGFIPVSQFDSNLTKYRDIWLSIWKVSPEAKTPMLGIALLSYLYGTLKPRSIIGVTMSSMAKRLFSKIKSGTLGLMNHYYIINQAKNTFGLIDNFDGKYCNECSESDHATSCKIEKIHEKDLNDPSISTLFMNAQKVPSKSLEYLRNRFLKHPIYKYEILGIKKSKKTLGIIIARIQSFNDHKALRIVDYYGDEKSLIELSDEFQRLLGTYDAEYLDFYNLGISEETMAKSGFLKRENGSEIIIPNYFEPFERKNVEFDYFCKSKEDIFICKADADQDRPNIIE